MNGVRTAQLFRRVDAIEHAWCLRLNRGCSRPAVRDIFSAISKLGDGVFWYVLILLLPVVYGETALYPALRMAAVGLIGLGLYKYLTTLTVSSFPELAWLLVPFAALVAASRVVLGLHYPTDVAAGALIGVTLAVLSMVLFPLVT
jgi:undecaprenyl-diphosphatase